MRGWLGFRTGHFEIPIISQLWHESWHSFLCAEFGVVVRIYFTSISCSFSLSSLSTSGYKLKQVVLFCYQVRGKYPLFKKISQTFNILVQNILNVTLKNANILDFLVNYYNYRLDTIFQICWTLKAFMSQISHGVIISLLITVIRNVSNRDEIEFGWSLY